MTDKYSFSSSQDPSEAIKSYLLDSSSFIRAIDWDEPFIIGLGLFHCLTFVFLIATRRSPTFLISNFLFLTVAVLSASSINSYLARHPPTKQNYFDANGVWITAVYAFPLLINMIISLTLLLVYVSSRLIHVKRLQLAAKRSKKEK